MSQRITSAKFALREYPKEYLTLDQYTKLRDEANNTVDTINNAITKLDALEKNVFSHIDEILLEHIKSISEEYNKKTYNKLLEQLSTILYEKLFNDLIDNLYNNLYDRLYDKIYSDVFNNLYTKLTNESNKTIINTVQTNIKELRENIMSKRLSKSYQQVKKTDSRQQNISAITKEIITNLTNAIKQNDDEQESKISTNAVDTVISKPKNSFEEEYEQFIANLKAKTKPAPATQNTTYIDDFKNEYNNFITGLKCENKLNESLNTLIDSIESEILEILDEKLNQFTI